MPPMQGDAAIGTITLALTGDGYVGGLSRKAADGALAWRLDPPDGPGDAFVSVEVHPGELILASWSGWRVTVDPVSGTERGRVFTK